MNSLSQALLEWYQTHRRELPWRTSRDPYRIWVSEIMLQQTRVAAVIPYFEKFLERFPDVQALAAAPESDLLAAWAGLGYYSRARNLQKAARMVVEWGEFPRTYEGLRMLPGVGEYTAAAIASIAFQVPEAVLDGNVLRVMSRVQGDEGDIRTVPVRRRLREAAQRALDRRQPGEFNQALMELGATVCLPGDPPCLLCPIRDFCEAYRTGRQRSLPVKTKGPATRKIDRTVYVIERDRTLLLWSRSKDSARLAGFWELPEAEHVPDAHIQERLGGFRHTIVNHDYRFEVWRARVEDTPPGCHWIEIESLARYPLSTSARKALRQAGESIRMQPQGRHRV